MKIAILGAGHVGTALGRAWAKKNHDVVFGVREPESAKTKETLSKLGVRASAADVASAAKGAEVVVLCTPFPATKEALSTAGNLAGKVVIDCTNPLKPDMSGLSIGHTTSAGEEIAAWAKGASVFKTFNHTGAPNMAAPERYPTKLAMFVCGDDAARKPVVMQLVREVGFEAIDAGPMTVARLLEPLAMLWIHLAYAQKQGTDFAFAIARPAK